jgi:hypothetical protein
MAFDVETKATAVEAQAVTDRALKGKGGEERRQKAVTRLLAHYDAYASWRKAHVEDGLNACYRAYQGYRPRSSSYHHTYVIREIFRQVETLKPEVFERFFSREQLFRYKAKRPGFEEAAAAATQIVHDQLAANLGRNMRALWDWMDTAILWGTSYLIFGWRSFKHTQWKINRVHDPVTREPWWDRETDEVIEEGPYLDHRTPFEVYTHPEVADVGQSPVVFQRETITPAGLKTLVRSGWADADLVKKAAAGGKLTALDIEGELRPEDFPLLDLPSEEDERMELLTGWTNDGWEYGVLNREYLIRAREMEFARPTIVCLRNYPQVREHYGTPEPLVLLEEQNLLNDFMSMFADGVHFTCNPMFKMTREAHTSWLQTYFQPGGAVVLDKLDQLAPLGVNPAVLDLPNVAGFILNNMKATGIRDVAQLGQPTATQHMSVVSAAGKRVSYKIARWKPEFRHIYTALYELNRLYLDQEVAVRMEGPAGAEAFARYEPTVFDADVDVQVELADEAEADPEAALRWQNALRLSAGDPGVDRAALWERFFRAMRVREPRKLLLDPTLAYSDAQRENTEAVLHGFLPLPRAQDNDQIHLGVHAPLRASPLGRLQEPEAMASFERHCMAHAERLMARQQSRAQFGTAMEGPGPGEMEQRSGSPVPAADERTEGLFLNGPRGAAWQGGMEGAR